MNLRSLFAVAAIVAATVPAHAATVVAWDFESFTAPSGTSTTLTGVASSIGLGTASSVHASAATFSTVAGNGSTKSLSSNTWAVGDYYQFSFNTLGFSGLSLSFDQAGSSTGPAAFTASYSFDGGTTFSALGSYTVALSTWNATTTQTGFTQTFALGSAFDNKGSVIVRLTDNAVTSIGGSTVAVGGTDRVDNFVVQTVTAVPEPETYAMLFAGLGVVGFIARRRKQA